jgi:hypothetical protein
MRRCEIWNPSKLIYDRQTRTDANKNNANKNKKT